MIVANDTEWVKSHGEKVKFFIHVIFQLALKFFKENFQWYYGDVFKNLWNI